MLDQQSLRCSLSILAVTSATPIASRRDTGSATTFGSTHCSNHTHDPLAAELTSVSCPVRALQSPITFASFV